MCAFMKNFVPIYEEKGKKANANYKKSRGKPKRARGNQKECTYVGREASTKKIINVRVNVFALRKSVQIFYRAAHIYVRGPTFVCSPYTCTHEREIKKERWAQTQNIWKLWKFNINGTTIVLCTTASLSLSCRSLYPPFRRIRIWYPSMAAILGEHKSTKNTLTDFSFWRRWHFMRVDSPLAHK